MEASAVNDQINQPLRIMIAMNAFYHCKRCTEIAAGLAARQNLELSAIFVEDVNLVNLAHLPFTTEIDRLSAVEKELDAIAMTQTLEAQLDWVRGLIAAVSEEKQMTVSLRVVRGHFLAEALSAVSERDVLFLGREAELSKTQAGAKRPLPSGWPAKKAVGKPVWVLFDGTAESQRALVLAQNLAAAEDKPWFVVLIAEQPKDANALRKEVSRLLTDGPPSRFIVMPSAELAKLLGQIRKEGCSLVVVNRDLCQDYDEAQAILEGANCPIVMVA